MEGINETLLLTDSKLFGDYEEHEYHVLCLNGRAVAIPTDDELEANPKLPSPIELVYPKLENMTDAEKRECLNYRGIYDEPESKCNYGDVCLKFGIFKQHAKQ